MSAPHAAFSVAAFFTFAFCFSMLLGFLTGVSIVSDFLGVRAFAGFVALARVVLEDFVGVDRGPIVGICGLEISHWMVVKDRAFSNLKSRSKFFEKFKKV